MYIYTYTTRIEIVLKKLAYTGAAGIWGTGFSGDCVLPWEKGMLPPPRSAGLGSSNPRVPGDKTDAYFGAESTSIGPNLGCLEPPAKEVLDSSRIHRLFLGWKLFVWGPAVGSHVSTSVVRSFGACQETQILRNPIKATTRRADGTDQKDKAFCRQEIVIINTREPPYTIWMIAQFKTSYSKCS